VTIDRIDLRILRLPLVRFFETSFGRSHDRVFLLVCVAGEGLEGWGECVADQHPFYSPETTDTAWQIVVRYIAPRVLNRTFRHPAEIGAALSIVRGHRMAKAAVEMAAWDLHARQLGEPLWRVLGGDGGPIVSGVSIGIQDSIGELADRVGAELAAGYRRIKVKIKPGWDLGAVAAIRERFPAVPLMVDANAAYDLKDADHLGRLDAYDLMMIEQPLDSDDIADHARLQTRLRTPLCLDESIQSARDARLAIECGACRVVNVKPGRLGGYTESVRVHDVCASYGVPVWHGGMLESGIGRAHNLHLSTLPNFRLPGDVAASRRYYDPDLIEPPIDVRNDGTICVPGGPGIGVTLVPDRIARATVRAETLTEP
jgi:O-succinylbenzoate synthase